VGDRSVTTPTNWKAAVRVDVGGRLAKATKTAVGVRLDGVIAKSGVLAYRRADGTTIREYLPPDEAARADSLATLRDAPVTVQHPGGGTRMVTPATVRTDSVGHVSGEPRVDAGRVVAALAIQEHEAITRIDRGELVELSAGYGVMIDPTPGTTPEGERYDAIQRERVYNHVALLPRGAARAGSEASLRLDGVEQGVDVAFTRIDDDDVRAPTRALETRTDTMKTDRIDGIDYEIGSPAWHQARERYDAKVKADLAAAEKRASDAEAKATATQARADASDARVRALEAQTAPAALDQRVTERAALVAKATAILGAETKLDGKSDHEIRAAVIAKLDPEFKVDSIAENERELYVRVRFDAETRAAKTTQQAPLHAARRDAVVVPGIAPRVDGGNSGARPKHTPLIERISAGTFRG
jgi:hypothetical protein